jgi:hypothetical protein
MSMKLSEVRQTVKQLLVDEFVIGADLVWEDDEIDEHIKNCVYQLSAKSPYRALEPVKVTANSKILDISGIADLIEVKHIEYEPGSNPRNFHNFSYLDNQTIEMEVDSGPAESGISGTLTGTVTFSVGSSAVTGSGTAFSTELKAWDYIKPSTKSRWYRIYSVDSDTSLTLDEPVKSANAGADTASATQYRHLVALVYYDKLHTLTEEETTLNPNEESALILGVCGQAAVSKSRYLMNRVNTGGGNVASQMEGWGLTRIQLFEQALLRLQPPRTKKVFGT